jgi:hypothetical protein
LRGIESVTFGGGVRNVTTRGADLPSPAGRRCHRQYDATNDAQNATYTARSRGCRYASTSNRPNMRANGVFGAMRHWQCTPHLYRIVGHAVTTICISLPHETLCTALRMHSRSESSGRLAMLHRPPDPC